MVLLATVYLPVQHPRHDVPLWLVVSRMGKGHKPWYLTTNEPIPLYRLRSPVSRSSIDPSWLMFRAFIVSLTLHI